MVVAEYAREEDGAIEFAHAINYNLFSRPTIYVPVLKVDQKYIDEYREREKSIASTPVYATGKDKTAVPDKIRVAILKKYPALRKADKGLITAAVVLLSEPKIAQRVSEVNVSPPSTDYPMLQIKLGKYEDGELWTGVMNAAPTKAY